MRENEFEKQVRKLMDEFRLSPSASVWEQVRAHIVQRRRKWPLAAVLLISMIGTGYLMYQQFEGKQATILSTKENNRAEKIPGNPNKEQSTKQNKTSVLQPDSSTKNNITGTEKANAVISLKSLDKNVSVTEPVYQKEKKDKEISTTPQIEVAGNDQGNNLGKEEIVSASLAQQNDSKTSKDVKTDSIVQPIQKPDTTALLTNAPTKKTSRKLSIGITAYAGSSNTVDNLFGAGDTKNTMPANFIVDPLSAGTSHPEKPFTPSFAYKFGGFIEKDISSKNSLSLGVNYSYFSTKAQVTYANPSLLLVVPGPAGVAYINNYYRPATTREKNMQQLNKYNFIGVDAAFHQSLIRAKKTPLYLDAGFSALRLLSANALIYDNNTNTYYYKNDWLHKWQASFNTGVSLHVNMNSNNYLFVGPEASYGFTNLLKNKNYTPQHLFSYGLKVGWVTGKK